MTPESSARRAYTFFLVTYLFSWTMFAVGHSTGILPVILLGVWGPSLMAVVLTRVDHGADGLRHMLRRFLRVKVHPVWWLLLLFLPASVHLLGRSLWQLASTGGVDASLWFSVASLVTSFLIAGLGEELGWRGFALPRLQRRFSPLVASLILATAHFFWHLPTYWLGQGIHNVPLLYTLGFAIPWTILFTWIYNRSGGSLLFAVGFHALSNTSLAAVRFMPLESEIPISPELITRIRLPAELAGPYLSVVAVYWVVALIVVLAGGLRPANTDVP